MDKLPTGFRLEGVYLINEATIENKKEMLNRAFKFSWLRKQK